MEYTFYKDDPIIGVLECLQGLADKKEPFPEDCSNWSQD